MHLPKTGAEDATPIAESGTEARYLMRGNIWGTAGKDFMRPFHTQCTDGPLNGVESNDVQEPTENPYFVFHLESSGNRGSHLRFLSIDKEASSPRVATAVNTSLNLIKHHLVIQFKTLS
jgi:hypothetical protein